MIKGITKNIALLGGSYKDLKEEETIVPAQIDLRNGYITEANHWAKRKGYALWKSLGENSSVILLIPRNNGYAITSNGKVFSLSGTSPTEYTTQKLSGYNRPTWLEFESSSSSLIILCDGGTPVKIENGDTALLGGSPPNGKFVNILSNYTIISGSDSRTFYWSASGNPENWSGGDSGNASMKMDGGIVKMAKVFDERIYFFKDTAIECWYNRGGTTPFVRLNNYSIWDSSVEAGYSVVKANNTIYWLDSDGDFKRLEGNKGIIISKPYRKYLDSKLKHKSEVFGFDCRQENCIRWFSPNDGLCIRYDYHKNIISEDNGWVNGWVRLPFKSYMEFNGEQYFGSHEPVGEIYHWSNDYFNDNGTEIRTYRKYKVVLSPHKASVNRLRLVLKRAVETSSEDDPKAELRYKFDEARTWELAEEFSLGELEDGYPFIDFFRLGVGREITFEIYHADSTDFLIREIYLTYDIKGR